MKGRVVIRLCTNRIASPRIARSFATRKRNVRETSSEPLTKEPLDIIGALFEAERVSGTILNFAKLVSIGNQSSGKSSAIEAITGMDIFPKKKGMASKRPLRVRLKRVDTGRWAEFADGSKLYNFSEIQKRIERENELTGSSMVSDQPLDVTICAPDVYPLSVIDLPGYISVVKKGEDQSLPKKIRELNKPYVMDHNSIPLVVTSATEDPANCKGLQEVYKRGAQDRSFGLVTKMDLPKSLDATTELLSNKLYPLGFGFFGTVLRGVDALKNGVTIQEQFEEESRFFKSKGLLGREDESIRLGIPNLQRVLSETLVQMVSPQLPHVIEELDTIIEKLEKNESFLSQLASEPNLDTVSKDLTMIVKRLHTESSYRTAFEKGFRKKLRDEIRKMIEQEFRQKFPEAYSDDKDDLSWVDRKVARDNDPEHPYEDQVGNKRIGMTNAIGEMLSHRYTNVTQFSSEKGFNVDRLHRMFIFGENSPEKETDSIFHNLKDKFIEMGTLLSFFTFRIPDDRNASRVQWVEKLSRTVSSLIDRENSNNLQELSYSLIMTDLHEFINSIQIDNPNPEKTELAREFGKYLFDKIGKQIYGSGLQEAIYHHLNTEKRPDPNFHALGHELTKLTGHPKKFSYWFGNCERYDVDVYGPEWTRSYANMLINRTSDNLFKTIGVNLLDPLIEEAIRYSLETFRGDHVAEEASRQARQITQLKEHRATLQRAVELYTKPSNFTRIRTKD